MSTNNLHFEGKSYPLESGESVLDCLLRHGQAVSSLCRSGACQSCMLKATAGVVPAAAQVGLKDAWKKQGCFLACVCRPQAELSVERCEVAGTHSATVTRVRTLGPNVLGVWLSRPAALEFQAGQFVQLARPSDGLTRAYSVASLPSEGELELHVALLPNGQMSGWLSGGLGEQVTVRGPFGECFYQADEADRPLVLAGTGTGLSPLLGVLRTAARHGHRGRVSLFHGSPKPSGIYLRSELALLAEQLPGLELFGSVLSGDESELGARERWHIEQAPLEQMLLARYPKFDAHRLFLCGHPTLVQALRKRAYLAGAPLARIHCDAFAPPHPI